MDRSMKGIRNEKGITLVALVITIIILLILAGITIGLVTGKNGILMQATRATEETKIAQEKEGLLLSITNYQIDKKEENKLGAILYDKNAENSTIWDVIVADEVTYGTD